MYLSLFSGYHVYESHLCFLYSCSFLILFLFSLPCYQCAIIYLSVFCWGWIFWKVFNLWLLCWSEYLDMSVLLCKHVLFYLLYIWRVNWDFHPNLIMSTSLPKWFYQFIYTPTWCLWELLFFHIFTLSVILILGFRMGRYWFYFIAVSIYISLITNEGGQLFNVYWPFGYPLLGNASFYPLSIFTLISCLCVSNLLISLRRHDIITILNILILYSIHCSTISVLYIISKVLIICNIEWLSVPQL